MDWLNPLDAAMVTAEVSSPLNIGAVLIVSPPARTGAHYVEHLYHASLTPRDPLHPWLTRYPHRGARSGGAWVWRQCDAVDLSQHYTYTTLPPGSDRQQLWQLISQLHAQPLDRTRPMWMSYVIDGLPDGRFAFYIKVHHSVIDGVAGFQAIAEALSADPHLRQMPAFHAHRSAGGTRRQTRHGRWPTPWSAVRSLAGGTADTVAVAQRATAAQVSNLVAAQVTDTTVAPLAAPHMAFNGRLGAHRTVAGANWPRPRIRTVQHKAAATANDVMTAIVAGALRDWLAEHGQLPSRSLVAICPITVRPHHGREHDDRGGNKFGAWLCPLGTDIADPAQRLDLIHRAMAEGKHQVARRGAAASLLSLAPSICSTVLSPLVPLTPKIRTGYNLPISHVRGPATEMYWNGCHVEEIYPVSAVYDGQVVNVTTCSYGDHIGVGYVADRDVIADSEHLIALTERALTELEVAVGVTRRTQVR
ncbi:MULTISPECIES: wax ester/triacylglycerol synthase family O-acyltransferase [Mycolicibacterium]|uniref:wax ester/triacylglycerol synthase family O-acyltransferase n=1 Tax=Mycolicibacterium TaxID=1866885 RepID=UPI00148FD18B|nr:wax ester/triacylglycerol synthase family O-acyltransferase [Mycolicibacterium fortuitum]